MLTWARQIALDGSPADVTRIVSDFSEWLKDSPVPKLWVRGDPGFIYNGRLATFCKTFQNQTEVVVKGQHFLQETSGPEIGKAEPTSFGHFGSRSRNHFFESFTSVIAGNTMGSTQAAPRRKAVPHRFVLDAIAEVDPTTRAMFGAMAVYVGEKIVFLLGDRPEHTGANGVWVAIPIEYQESLRGDFPTRGWCESWEKILTAGACFQSTPTISRKVPCMRAN